MKSYGLAMILLFSVANFVTRSEDESADLKNQSTFYVQKPQVVKPNSTKPKKYKCVLVDEDADNDLVLQNAGTSYVSELQQRRLQAANQADKTQQISRRIATPTLTKPQKNQVEPTKRLRTTGSFAIPRTDEASSVVGLKNRPLKQITLTKPASNLKTEPIGFSAPVEQITTPASTTLKLSQEYCNMIKHYAQLYNVHDVVGFVKRNCAFAKTYLPNATCEEINILVSSCYRFFTR